jgi:hypothetical protein
MKCMVLSLLWARVYIVYLSFEHTIYYLHPYYSTVHLHPPRPHCLSLLTIWNLSATGVITILRTQDPSLRFHLYYINSRESEEQTAVRTHQRDWPGR